MVHAYVRVSTDRQTIENQKFEIRRFCEENNCLFCKVKKNEGL